MAPTDGPREPEAPAALQRDLRAVFGRRVEVPPAADEALLAAARARPTTRPSTWSRPLVAAAAAVVVAALLGVAGSYVATGWFAQRAVEQADFDRDGKVDVLDAYRLALALQQHEQVPPAFDLDGDGIVDARDVEWIAKAAVAGRGA